LTLRFLGEVAEFEPVRDALTQVDASVAIATIGPRAALLGRGVVQLPVGGLNDLATSVVEATRSLGEPPPARPFRGHLTLARTNGVKLDKSALELHGEWTVHDVELIRSHLGRGGARYETLATFALRGV
jgi:2'-5' RNA ligase